MEIGYCRLEIGDWDIALSTLAYAVIGWNRLEYAVINWNRQTYAGISWNRQRYAGIGKDMLE